MTCNAISNIFSKTHYLNFSLMRIIKLLMNVEQPYCILAKDKEFVNFKLNLNLSFLLDIPSSMICKIGAHNLMPTLVLNNLFFFLDS